MRKLTLLLTVLAGFSVFLFTSKISASNINQGPRIRAKDGTSTNWSGYAVETSLTKPQSNAVSDVKGTWVVPAVTCTSQNTYSSAWVGIDGYSDNSVEQTGTEQDCINGKATYYTWYEMYPKGSYGTTLAINPNDTIFAEVAYVAPSNFVLTLKNLTTGKSFTTTQKSGKAQRQSAEWIMEAPWSGGVLPLANFGTAKFTNSSARINGLTGSISAFAKDQINMVNSSGSLKDQTSALDPTGSAFSVSWISSN